MSLDDSKLEAVVAFCDAMGATSVADLVECELLDGLMAELDLKPVPAKKLSISLKAMAAEEKAAAVVEPEAQPELTLKSEAAATVAEAVAGGGSRRWQRQWQRSWKQAAAMAEAELRVTQPFPYDCFLTHDWGTDEHGRSNHARVARVCKLLKDAGMRPWFDEEQMQGDINRKMVAGIEGSATVVCFITKRYLQKAWGEGPNGEDDNCKLELDYACRRKGVARMIAVVMEQGCRNPSEWFGTVGAKLGGKLYINLSSDDADAFDRGITRLAAEIRLVLASDGADIVTGIVGHPE